MADQIHIESNRTQPIDAIKEGANPNNLPEHQKLATSTSKKQNSTMDDFPESANLVGTKTKWVLCIICITVYPLLWIFYVIFGEALWEASIDTSAVLSSKGGSLFQYFWFFSHIAYNWYIAIVGILLLFSPRREGALVGISIFLLSYQVRVYLNLLLKDDRTIYLSPSVTRRESCECTWGMPSGHAEGSIMLFSILCYQLIIQTKHFSRGFKLISIGVVTFLVLNVMLSRIYFGAHTIPQVLIGAGQGLFALSIMVLFERHLENFFRKFLNGNKRNFIILFSAGLTISLLNLIMWFSYFNIGFQDSNKSTIGCDICFVNNSYLMKIASGKGLVLPTIYLGLIVGIYFGKPMLLEHNDKILRMHLSLKGLWRVLLMGAMHLLLLIVMLIKANPNWLVPVSAFIYLVTGFLITFVDFTLMERYKINFKGDIILTRCRRIDQAVQPDHYQLKTNPSIHTTALQLASAQNSLPQTVINSPKQPPILHQRDSNSFEVPESSPKAHPAINSTLLQEKEKEEIYMTISKAGLEFPSGNRGA